MPYTINWSDDHTIVVFTGLVTFQELREIGATHYGDSRFDDLRYVIVDFSQADLAQITLDEPIILASLDSVAVAYNARLKLALVIADEYQRSLCEKYIKDSIDFHSSWSHRIFSTLRKLKNGAKSMISPTMRPTKPTNYARPIIGALRYNPLRNHHG